MCGVDQRRSGLRLGLERDNAFPIGSAGYAQALIAAGQMCPLGSRL
jgi:hypothetical protein